ncbi:MAG: hypothetical protein A3H98_02960 [Bacteroidetes bacterium RIFCSPLOWO2_02_FULL_36_8]|nr:MAG: hypothetical protein A3H98_02960 [Bacteroidetes bacterium RIFCSPLOWO2_02_FULL_36_8]
MAPTGFISSNQESELNYFVHAWNRKSKLGYVFSSNAGFNLPNKVMRSPDVAWIAKERCDALPREIVKNLHIFARILLLNSVPERIFKAIERKNE